MHAPDISFFRNTITVTITTTTTTILNNTPLLLLNSKKKLCQVCQAPFSLAPLRWADEELLLLSLQLQDQNSSGVGWVLSAEQELDGDVL